MDSVYFWENKRKPFQRKINEIFFFLTTDKFPPFLVFFFFFFAFAFAFATFFYFCERKNMLFAAVIVFFFAHTPFVSGKCLVVHSPLNRDPQHHHRNR